MAVNIWKFPPFPLSINRREQLTPEQPPVSPNLQLVGWMQHQVKQWPSCHGAGAACHLSDKHGRLGCRKAHPPLFVGLWVFGVLSEWGRGVLWC